MGRPQSPGDRFDAAALLVGEILEHHGVKGQKWGVRKTDHAPSSDHVVAESHRARVKEGGLKVLSNADLESLNKRMQLEQTHRDLTEKAPSSSFDKTHAHIKKTLKVGKTLNDAHNTINGPVGKAVVKLLKSKK